MRAHKHTEVKRALYNKARAWLRKKVMDYMKYQARRDLRRHYDTGGDSSFNFGYRRHGKIFLHKMAE